MIAVEDCLRKAAQWLGESQVASDLKTSASMRRVSDAWTALAALIEQDHECETQARASIRRPADLSKRRGYSDTLQAAEVLRVRLHLSEEPSDGVRG